MDKNNSSIVYKIGIVQFYYEKTGFAILELAADLGVGEKIKFSDGKNEYIQNVEKIRIGHEIVTEANKGQTVAVLVEKEVSPGMEVFKI